MSWWRRIGYSRLSEYFEPSLLVGLWHWQARIHRHIKHVAEATIEGTFRNKIDQIRFSFLRSVLIHVPEVGWPLMFQTVRNVVRSGCAIESVESTASHPI